MLGLPLLFVVTLLGKSLHPAIYVSWGNKTGPLCSRPSPTSLFVRAFLGKGKEEFLSYVASPAFPLSPPLSVSRSRSAQKYLADVLMGARSFFAGRSLSVRSG